MVAAVGKSPPHSACFGALLQLAGSRPVLEVGHCKGIDGEENVLLGGMLSCSALRQRYRRKQASTRQGRGVQVGHDPHGVRPRGCVKIGPVAVSFNAIV